MLTSKSGESNNAQNSNNNSGSGNNNNNSLLSNISSSDVKKVVVVGGSKSGKTCLVVRGATNSYQEEYQQSFGADLYIKQVTGSSKGRKRTLHIWCCAGHERYRTLMEQFYEDADAVLIVFDMLSLPSFKEVTFWYNEAKRLAPNAYLYLVGAKVDEADNLKIRIPDGMKQAKEWEIPFKPISSKTGLNVQELFAELVDVFP